MVSFFFFAIFFQFAISPRSNRETAAEIFFETFGVPALFVSPQATLSLYASGRTTGVVLDSGDGVTHAVPVYEGYTMPHAITRMEVAGRDVTGKDKKSKKIQKQKNKKSNLTSIFSSFLFLSLFLEQLQRLLRRSGYTFHTTAEKEVVRAIKEEVCYVAFNPQREEQVEAEHHTEVKEYTLPDGRIVKVGAERFRAAEGKSHLNRYTHISIIFIFIFLLTFFSLLFFMFT